MSCCPIASSGVLTHCQKKDDQRLAELTARATDDELRAEIEALQDAADDCERGDERRRALLAMYATKRALRLREAKRVAAGD